MTKTKNSNTTLLTEELLSKKLKDWTLSYKLVSLFGFAEDKEPQLKKEILLFEEKGLVERTGAKKGLKFKYVKSPRPSDKSFVEEVSKDQQACEATVLKADESLEFYSSKKTEDQKEASRKKEFKDYINFILNASINTDSSISSYSFVLKKNLSGGYQLRLYSGITKVKEEEFTESKLLKFLQNSGVKLSD